MKRRPGLRDLSDDHHTALIVAVRCKRATEATCREIWREVRGAWEGHLRPHFALEEEVLLPALATLGHGDLVERIRRDHRELAAALDAEEPDLEHVAGFGTRLESHVRFEEREVFEPHQAELPDAVIEALVRASAEQPRVLDLTRLNALR